MTLKELNETIKKYGMNFVKLHPHSQKPNLLVTFKFKIMFQDYYKASEEYLNNKLIKNESVVLVLTHSLLFRDGWINPSGFTEAIVGGDLDKARDHADSHIRPYLAEIRAAVETLFV